LTPRGASNGGREARVRLREFSQQRGQIPKGETLRRPGRRHTADGFATPLDHELFAAVADPVEEVGERLDGLGGGHVSGHGIRLSHFRVEGPFRGCPVDYRDLLVPEPQTDRVSGSVRELG
jgi:hypothetical protein